MSDTQHDADLWSVAEAAKLLFDKIQPGLTSDCVISDTDEPKHLFGVVAVIHLKAHERPSAAELWRRLEEYCHRRRVEEVTRG